MRKADIPFLTAAQLGSLIRKKEVSPVEATEAYLERIRAIDPKVHGYITVTDEYALKAARQAEKAIAKGAYIGPLHGIPYAVKDQFWSKGILTTGGSNVLRDFVPAEDATVIARMNSAGAVLLGKLNLSEFATGNSVVHPWGIPRNPWDLERTPGTSSSGSGVAAAAFLCSTSLGEDTGGSIRGPANNCGLVGLRPTYGLVSRYGMLGASWSNDIGGPVSRTAEDAAITLQAIAGHDPKDPYTARYTPPDYRAGLKGGIKGLKVGIFKEAMYADFVHPETRKVVGKAVDKLKELGAKISEVSVPLMPYTSAINRIFIEVEAAHQHRQWLETRPRDYDHNVRTDFYTGLVTPANLYYKAQRLREMIRRQVFEALDKVDILALPGSSDAPPLISTKVGIFSKEEALSRMTGRRALNGAFNLASVPAMTFHCGFLSYTGKDLPIGLQIAGRPFSDGLLLRVAHTYGQATDWRKRRPPI
ncbi:MAG: amidase [SAR202 cluster bacterium]|nr:amidase [SAR202 cluster bacterium]